MTFPRVSRRGRHFANVGDIIIYPDLVVARTVYNRPAKSAKELGPVWQNIAGKSDIHGQKESSLELFRSRMHFGEIKQPKSLLISRNEQLYILRGRKSICVSRPLGWNKRQKFTFAQSKGFPPKHNLPIRENNSLEQSAFWHEVPTPPFFTLCKHN